MRPLLLSLLLSSWAWQFTAALTELTFPPEGYINLTKADSPYVVSENLTASGETEIFIESGVKMFVRPGLTVTISGSFHSFGTKDDPVVWDSLEGEDYLDSNFSSILQFYPNTSDHFVYKGQPICSIQLVTPQMYSVISRKSTKEKLIGQTICGPMGYESTAELADVTVPDHTTVRGWLFQCQLKAKSLDECRMYQNQNCDVGTWLRARCNGKSFHRNWGGLHFAPDLDKVVRLNHLHILNAGNQVGFPAGAVKLPNGRYEVHSDGLMVNNSFGVGMSVDRWNISGVTVTNCNEGGILSSLSIGSAPSLDRCQLENNHNFGLKVVSTSSDEIDPISFCASDPLAIVNMTEFDQAIHFTQQPIGTCTREFFIDNSNLFSLQFTPRYYSGYLTFKVFGRNNFNETYESLFDYSTFQVTSARYDYRYIRIQIYQYYSNSYNLLAAAIPRNTYIATITSTLVVANDVGLMLSTDNSLITYHLAEARLLHNQIGIQQSDVSQLLLVEESVIDSCAVGVVGKYANVLISNSNFTNCSVGLDITTTTNPSFVQSTSTSVAIENSLLQGNEVGLMVTGQTPLESVTIKNVKASENALVAVHITADADLVELKDSEFLSNGGSGTVVVNTVNVVPQGQLLITSCDFIDNSIDNLPHFQVGYGSNAVVKTNHHTNVSIRQCRFENPYSQYEVSLSFPYYDPKTASDPSSPFYNKKALDFTENWWGTVDLTDAALKIYDRNVHMTLQSTRLSPFYDTREMTNLRTGDFRLLRGTEIGGVLNGEAVIPPGEYQVVGDILVMSAAKLTLQPGVTLTFPPTSTLVVHGQLVSDAIDDDNINLSLLENATAPVQPGFTLKANNVNIASNATSTDWGTVCIDDASGTESYPSAATLCRWGGLKQTGANKVTYHASASTPAKYSRIRCGLDVSNPHQCVLTPCGQDEKDFCTSCQLLAVSCQSWGPIELTWEGVQLSAVASPSIIRNTKIIGANGGQLHTEPAALRIGYHRHEISNITIESDNPILISNISVLTPLTDVSATPSSDSGTTGITLNRPFDNAEFFVDPESLLDSCGTNTVAKSGYKILWLFKSTCYTTIEAFNTNMSVLLISTNYDSRYISGFHIQLVYPDGTHSQEVLWNSRQPLLVNEGYQLRISQTRSDQQSMLQLIGSSHVDYLNPGDEVSIHRTSVGKFKTGLQLLNYPCFNYQLDGLTMLSGIHVSMCHSYGDVGQHMSLSIANSQFSGPVRGRKGGIALYTDCVTDVLSISNCTLNSLGTALQVFAASANVTVEKSVISNSGVGLDIRSQATLVVLRKTIMEDCDFGIKAGTCDQLTLAFCNISGSTTGISASSISTYLKLTDFRSSQFYNSISTVMQQGSTMTLENSLIEGVATGTAISVTLNPSSQVILNSTVVRSFSTAVSCQLYGTGSTPSLMAITVADSLFAANEQAISINQRSCAGLNFTIKNVEFDGNRGGVAFMWHDTTGWSAVIKDSSFTSGANYVTGKDTTDQRCSSPSNLGYLSIIGNRFETGNVGKEPNSADVRLNSDINLNVSRNAFVNGDGRLAMDVSCTISSNELTLSHNIFTDNRMQLGLVDIATCRLSMTHNTFINNSWPHVTSDDPCSDPSLNKLLSSRQTCSRLNATLNMRLSELPDEFHHNVFSNNAKPEMYLTFDTFPPNRNWNGSHNYWGENMGLEAAIVLENGNVRPRVTLSPIFTSTDMTETAEGRIDPVAFKSPHANFDTATGTFTSDTTLVAAGSPYEFQQDAYVPADVTLTVEMGATLNFVQRTRLLVDGNLVAVGSADHTIVFDAADQNLPRANSKRFRIEESTNLLQALYSGQWYYVQAQNSQFSISDICYYIYRSFPLSATTISKGPGSYPTTYVNCAHFSEESSCYIGLTYNTPADIWVLQCGQQSQWEGIYVRSAQTNSVLKHIEIRNAGATRQGEMGVALQTSADLKQMSQVGIVRSGGSGLYLKSLTHDNPLNPTIVSDISTTDIAGVSLLWPRQYSLNVSRISGLNVGLAGVVQLPIYNNFNGIREPTAIVGDFVICQIFPIIVPSDRRRFLSNNRVNLWLPSRLCCEMAFVTEPTFSLVFYIQIPSYCGITFTDSESNPVSPTTYVYNYYQGNYLTAYETYASSVRMIIFCSTPASTPFEMFVESQKAVWHDRLENKNQLLVDFDTTRVSVIKIPDRYIDFNPGNAQGHVLSISHSSTSLDPANVLTSVEMDFRDICFMTVARAVYPKPQFPKSVLHQISLVLNNGSSYNLHRSNATLSSQFEEFGVDLAKFSTESTVGKLQFRIDVTSDYDAEIWFDDFAIIPCNRRYGPSSSLASLNFKNVGDNGVHLTTDNSTEVFLYDSYFESVGLSHALPTNYHLERAAISLGDLTSSYITSDVHISNVHVTKANVPVLQINSAKTVHLHNNSVVDNVVVTGTDVFNIATQTSQMSHSIIADNLVNTNQFLTITGSMSAIQHSYFSNNTCSTCSSLLYTYGLELTADQNVVIDNNFTYSPSLQGILYFYSSAQSNWHNSYIFNQICDSQHKCPVEVYSASSNFNVSYNYWNTEVDDDVVPRIRPNVDTDPFLPIIRQPPEIYGLNSFSCNAHEFELSGLCWYTSPGFVPCEEAKSICDAKGTSMAALSLIPFHQSTLEHVAGGHSFWLLNETSHNCVSYTREPREGDTFALASFQQLSSVLCTREAISSCPATCVSPRGVCKGFLCSCKPGWTGWDCLKPVCPRDCSGNGECTADGCICIPGWYGDACSITRCPIYVDCITCAKAPNCGWCDETSKCIPGNAYGTVGNSTINHCKNFFFYGCTTADNSAGCSPAISKLDCLSRFCGDKEFDEFACMRCQDIQDCYAMSTGEKSCQLWNETRCPRGKIAPDYNDNTRANKTRIRKDVVAISLVDPLIYKCSFKQNDNEPSTILVSKGNRWDLVNKTVISAQAGGFIVKTGELLKLGEWSFVGATKASLADVIDYADFQSNGESSSYGDIIDSASVDDSAIDLLTELSMEQPTSFVNLQSAAVIYKLVGETVRNDSNGFEIHSLVLAVPKGFKINVQSNTVVFANGTYPYIENVEAVDQITETAKLVTTGLHVFSIDDLKITTDKLNKSGNRQYECGGGSHWSGIAAYNAQSAIQQNDVVIGRQSGSFAIHVVDIQIGDEFQFIIGWPLVDISANGSYTTLHSAFQRSSFTTGISIHEYIDCRKYFADPGNCLVRIDVESRATLQLNVGLHFTKYPYIDGGVGMMLTATAESGLSLRYSKLRPRIGSLQSIFTTKAKIEFIPIFGVPIPIGTFGFVGLQMTAEFDPTVGVDMSAGVHVDYMAVVSIGSTSLGNSRQQHDQSISQNEFSLLKSSEKVSNPHASLSYFLKVGVRTEFPYLSQLQKKLLDVVDKLPDYLQPLAKKVAEEAKLDIFVEAYTGPSYRVDATICGCTTAKGSCSPDPTNKPNSVQLRVGPIVGVNGGGEFMGYTADLPIETSTSFYDNQQCVGPKFDSCSTEKTDNNCSCSCLDGSTGDRKLDGSCNCPCNCPCTQCDGTATGKVNWLGRCSCDCDDGKCCNRHPDDPSCQNDKPDPPIDNGLSPACPPYKMGPDCTDLDCSYGNGCSGNGFCVVAEDKQKTRCSCYSPFEGQRCQNVIPRAHGDPHLATRDGFYYDFMGLGEYWYCQADPFQLQIQSRFFKDSRWNASYIGGMAVKLRDVTVSVVTAVDPTGGFKLRVNGVVQTSLTHFKSLSDGSATLTVDNSRVSLEFQSGETFGWNVVKRNYAQWLEFSYSLTFYYDGKTKGLCGDGDGDINNDFTGPDGNLYSNAWDFGYSWKVADGESIYHPDDKMDDRYEDKPGEHRLDPSDINSTDIYRQAKSECESQHFSLAILTDMCILDVVVTKDLENVNQQGLKASSCPNSCSGRGDCQRDNTCKCITGWSGEECNERQCNPECSDFGQCVDGFCKCQNGYEGLDCAKQTDCATLNNCTDPLHGICISTGVCQCNGGFSGSECSQKADCTSLNGCSGNGKCVNNEKCLCDTGYKGKTCDTYSCEILNSCSGHGRCDGFDVCVCNSGYTGLSCLQFACPNDCSGNGRCTGPLKCDCYAGYTGDDCATQLHCATLNNCTSQGACVAQLDNMNITTEVCRCFSGYSGLECAEVDCSEEQNCSGHGWCREPNLCVCDEGYTGANCNSFTCLKVSNCFGNGNCTALDTCECSEDWSGADCSIPACNNCSSSTGRCIGPNKCQCLRGFTGSDCSTPIQSNNRYDPEFSQPSYTVTISTEVKIGSVILVLMATDKDTGDSAKISYAIAENSGWAREYFTVGKSTGQIIVTSSPSTFGDVFKVMQISASDSGYPVRSVVTTVSVTIRSPKCTKALKQSPTQFIAQEQLVDNNTFVLSVATDDTVAVDSVIYSFSDTFKSQSASKYFRLDNVTGELFIVDTTIPSQRYYVGVEAAQKDLPCSAATTAQVLVIAKIDPLITTTERPTKPTSTSTPTTTSSVQTTSTKTLPIETSTIITTKPSPTTTSSQVTSTTLQSTTTTTFVETSSATSVTPMIETTTPTTSTIITTPSTSASSTSTAKTTPTPTQSTVFTSETTTPTIKSTSTTTNVVSSTSSTAAVSTSPVVETSTKTSTNPPTTTTSVETSSATTTTPTIKTSTSTISAIDTTPSTTSTSTTKEILTTTTHSTHSTPETTTTSSTSTSSTTTSASTMSSSPASEQSTSTSLATSSTPLSSVNTEALTTSNSTADSDSTVETTPTVTTAIPATTTTTSLAVRIRFSWAVALLILGAMLHY